MDFNSFSIFITSDFENNSYFPINYLNTLNTI